MLRGERPARADSVVPRSRGRDRDRDCRRSRGRDEAKRRVRESDGPPVDRTDAGGARRGQPRRGAGSQGRRIPRAERAHGRQAPPADPYRPARRRDRATGRGGRRLVVVATARASERCPDTAGAGCCEEIAVRVARARAQRARGAFARARTDGSRARANTCADRPRTDPSTGLDACTDPGGRSE